MRLIGWDLLLCFDSSPWRCFFFFFFSIRNYVHACPTSQQAEIFHPRSNMQSPGFFLSKEKRILHCITQRSSRYQPHIMNILLRLTSHSYSNSNDIDQTTSRTNWNMHPQWNLHNLVEAGGSHSLIEVAYTQVVLFLLFSFGKKLLLLSQSQYDTTRHDTIQYDTYDANNKIPLPSN